MICNGRDLDSTENVVFSRFILKQLESSHNLSWSVIQRLLMPTEIIQARMTIKILGEFVVKRVNQVLKSQISRKRCIKHGPPCVRKR